MKNRIVTTALAVSAMTFALTGCSHQMSDEDIDIVRGIACSEQSSIAREAEIGLRELNPGKFWAVGPDVIEFSEIFATSGRMGEVADAYADFADMFPEKIDSDRGVFQEDVDTFNGHIAAIAAACEGNSDFEEPTVLEYPTDIEQRGYLQRVTSVEDVK